VREREGRMTAILIGSAEGPMDLGAGETPASGGRDAILAEIEI